jgi:pimeloyl-ACP methyl ester carboxylesterase
MPAKRMQRRAVLQLGFGMGAAAAATNALGAEGRRAATFVLVHPAWHGAWCWKKVAPLLRAAQHDVYTPTLTGLGERSHLAHPMIGLDTHVQDVVNVLEYEDLRDVILLGHSNGGTLITAVADRMAERIGHLVYLDAWVPEDGQATLDLLPPKVQQELRARVRDEGHGWLLPSLRPIPWDEMVRDVWRVTDEADRRWMVARLGPTPFKTFTDPVRRRNAAAEKLPRTYIRCVQHPQPLFDRYAELAKRTAGWRYRELPTAHHPAFTMPQGLAELLLELA